MYYALLFLFSHSDVGQQNQNYGTRSMYEDVEN